ncbi:hypothetical protein A8C32_14740 [Flavivirga aquatica]|uniref:Uncharacterized protein n=1 Tax=Flavivirga aquatica TaxID=1849968 RepID=A0A1E5T9M4_9FLAO|nr:hypothetical protein [Flavivirga aquatica]OEK08090.1 hypothetical protein A8C32_14740 [Flavivirga aquatica]
MRIPILCFIVVFVCSCKTKLIEVPDVVYEKVEYYPHDHNQPLGDDVIVGFVKLPDGKMLISAPVKLIVNDSTCVNAYSDFDGQFAFLYEKEW